MSKAVIVDSNFVGYRSKYAMGGTVSDDLAIGIIFGFFTEIMSLAKKFSTNNFVFCWDSRQSLRKRLEKTYKKTRHTNMTAEEKKELLVSWQAFTRLRNEILPIVGFRNVFMESGFEGDDLIASLCRSIEGDKIIVGSDEDLFQLLGYCDMWIPGKDKTMTKDLLLSERRFTPPQWAKMKAIAGCGSDEVKGIAGVGEKSVADFFTGDYNPKHKRFANILLNRKKYLERNLPLVRLPFKNTPTFQLLNNDYDFNIFEDMCNEFGFTSFMEGKKREFWKKFFSNDLSGFGGYSSAIEAFKARQAAKKMRGRKNVRKR